MDDYGRIDLGHMIHDLSFTQSSRGLDIEMDSKNLLPCVAVQGSHLSFLQLHQLYFDDNLFNTLRRTRYM